MVNCLARIILCGVGMGTCISWGEETVTNISLVKLNLVPKMPYLNYHGPVLFTNVCEQAVAPVMYPRQTGILVHMFVNI